MFLPGVYLPVSGAPEQSGASPQASIARYEARVAELEAAAGPHAEELIEVRQSLGLLLQQAGEHGRAVAALQQALQSVRVNEGLYSMSQIPILEAIIDSHAALGARDELRRNYEYLFWVYSRTHAGDRNARPGAGDQEGGPVVLRPLQLQPPQHHGGTADRGGRPV